MCNQLFELLPLQVLRAKQMGTIAFDRPTVLRETVQFFLQFKHYWSSHDYDRISNLVVELFPEFKDSETPGVPVNVSYMHYCALSILFVIMGHAVTF